MPMDTLNLPTARVPPVVPKALLAAFLVLGGCAKAPLATTTQMSRSHAAIDAAKDSGADEVPSAAVHLQLARDQVEQAQKLIAEQQPERAEYLLMRAEADAELALALAREAPARALAQDALDRVQALEDSLELQTTDLQQDTEGAEMPDRAPAPKLQPSLDAKPTPRGESLWQLSQPPSSVR